MEPFLSVQYAHKKYGKILGLKGQLTFTTREIFAQKIREIVSESVPGKLGLDLSYLDYLDSEGLLMLGTAAKNVLESGARLYLFGMNKDILEILNCVDFGVEVSILQNEKDFEIARE